MHYQNLIIIHECSKKLLKMKNSKFFLTPSTNVYMYTYCTWIYKNNVPVNTYSHTHQLMLLHVQDLMIHHYIKVVYIIFLSQKNPKLVHLACLATLANRYRPKGKALASNSHNTLYNSLVLSLLKLLFL